MIRKSQFRLTALMTVLPLALQGCIMDSSNSATIPPAPTSSVSPQDALATATPIKHVVVIFDENRSFDHYFGTYPLASNPSGEPVFTASVGTPVPDNLLNVSLSNPMQSALLTSNPNSTNTANGSGATNPFRLDRSQANTSDQNHAYTAEQQAYDNGLVDLFPKYTGRATAGGTGAFGSTGQVMGYFDGNTITGLWNYAQHFALSDNNRDDDYGPSTPGALELVSGQTNGVQLVITPTQPFTLNAYSYYISDGAGGYTLINDVDPANDLCYGSSAHYFSGKGTIMMTGKNIGDLLNAASVTWGGFQGGFNLSVTNSNGTTGCERTTTPTVAGMQPMTDYVVHTNWFQYFKSTANPTHARPSSTASIGYSIVPGSTTAEPANHEYGMNDFFAAVAAGNFPSVSILKAPGFQNGHPGYSDPLDEQNFVATVINFLQQQPDWKNTAVIITWDDSDGWYDHSYVTPTHSSYDAQADQVNGSGVCGSGTQPLGVKGSPVNGRCGPGTRIPLLVISPYAKQNYISHTAITLASVTQFIEDNWLNGQRLGGGASDAGTGSLMDMFDFSSAPNLTPLWIDPVQGTVLSSPPAGSKTPHTL